MMYNCACNASWELSLGNLHCPACGKRASKNAIRKLRRYNPWVGCGDNASVVRGSIKSRDTIMRKCREATRHWRERLKNDKRADEVQASNWLKIMPDLGIIVWSGPDNDEILTLLYQIQGRRQWSNGALTIHLGE